ncbi:hypothetical protein F5X99DRAFT_402144 [Biscogniauxia marginata]|nr:hypothetical protein F5X99DRAFT_402144 [Biscogniauxia marginata]
MQSISKRQTGLKSETPVRLPLAQAGSHLLDDLTWTTIGCLEWVQCEGPISPISVCLPNIFRFFKRIHDKGFKGTFLDSRGEFKMASSSVTQSTTLRSVSKRCM